MPGSGLGFLRREEPAGDGTRAEQGKVIFWNEADQAALQGRALAEDDGAENHRGGVGEHVARFAQELKFTKGEWTEIRLGPLPRGVDHGEVRMLVAQQRPQHHVAHRAKHRGIHTQPECEREDGDRGKTRGFGELAEGEFHGEDGRQKGDKL